MNPFMLLGAADKAVAFDANLQRAYLRTRARRAEARAADEGTSAEVLLRALLDRAPDMPPGPDDQVLDS